MKEDCARRGGREMFLESPARADVGLCGFGRRAMRKMMCSGRRWPAPARRRREDGEEPAVFDVESSHWVLVIGCGFASYLTLSWVRESRMDFFEGYAVVGVGVVGGDVDGFDLGVAQLGEVGEEDVGGGGVAVVGGDDDEGVGGVC